MKHLKGQQCLFTKICIEVALKILSHDQNLADFRLFLLLFFKMNSGQEHRS